MLCGYEFKTAHKEALCTVSHTCLLYLIYLTTYSLMAHLEVSSYKPLNDMTDGQFLI